MYLFIPVCPLVGFCTEDNRQCQILANLCVLNMYDDAAEACSHFAAITAGRSQDTRGVATWGSGMPWIQVSGCVREDGGKYMLIFNMSLYDTDYRPLLRACFRACLPV